MHGERPSIEFQEILRLIGFVVQNIAMLLGKAELFSEDVTNRQSVLGTRDNSQLNANTRMVTRSLTTRKNPWNGLGRLAARKRLRRPI